MPRTTRGKSFGKSTTVATPLTGPKRKQMTNNFVLVLSGISEPDDRIEDALFEAGCNDATLAFRNGVGYLEFDREAGSLEPAILSAVRDVERADHHATVSHVEPDDVVSASEIARRLDYTREYVRLLIQGTRGGGDFPAPCTGVTSTNLLWSWVSVTRWLSHHKKMNDPLRLGAAEIIRDINGALRMRLDRTISQRRLELLEKLPALATR